MAHIFTLANAKGGCGKSSVAFNLAICFAKEGYRTLAIDLDQQGNLSAAMGIDLEELSNSQLTSYRLLIDESADISKYIVDVRPKLSLLPNTIDIDADDLLEAKKVNRELLLKKRLKPIIRDFDLIVIDTPPAMRAATLNALAIADTVVIPIDSSYFALLGLSQLLRVIASVREAHKPEMVIRALNTMFNRKQNLDKKIRQRVEEFFGEDLVLQATINKNVAIAEAAALQKSVIEYAPAASGTIDFIRLAKELLEDTEHAQQEESRRSIRKSK